MKRLLFVLMSYLVMPLCFAATNISWKPWRIPQNQGINALFCYLQVHNVKCEYSDLVREQAEEIAIRPLSANTLVNLAKKHGIALQVSSITMKEFDSCERPFIAYMTSETPEDGAFLMVLNVAGGEVYYMEGATAAIHSMPIEGFRRVWSGIALLKTDAKTNWILFWLSLSAALAGFLGLRYKSIKKDF